MDTIDKILNTIETETGMKIKRNKMTETLIKYAYQQAHSDRVSGVKTPFPKEYVPKKPPVISSLETRKKNAERILGFPVLFNPTIFEDGVEVSGDIRRYSNCIKVGEWDNKIKKNNFVVVDRDNKKHKI